MEWINVRDELPSHKQEVPVWHDGMPKLATFEQLGASYEHTWTLFYGGGRAEITWWMKWEAPPGKAMLHQIDCCYNCHFSRETDGFHLTCQRGFPSKRPDWWCENHERNI